MRKTGILFLSAAITLVAGVYGPESQASSSFVVRTLLIDVAPGVTIVLGVRVATDGTNNTGISVGDFSGGAGESGGTGERTGDSFDPGNDGRNNHDNMGCGGMTGNPVIIASGHKAKTEVDFQTGHLYPLALVRNYNSVYAGGLFGAYWASSFDMRLAFFLKAQPNAPATLYKITATRADGSQLSYFFNSTSGRYQSNEPDADDWIVQQADGTWLLQGQDGRTETYDTSGHVTASKDPTGIGWTFAYNANLQMTRATHTNGLSIAFAYNANGRVSSVTDPAGKVYTYSYSSANGELSGVTYPNGDTRTYFYEDATQPDALTGIAVNGVRYSTYGYYADGRVHTSGLLDGSVEQDTFVYGTDAAGNPYTQVTDAAGAVATYTYQVINGHNKLIRQDKSGVTNCPNASATTHYDANGHPDYSFDQRGIKSTFVYSANGLLQDRVTGIDPNHPGQSRETQQVWDTTKNRITEIKRYGASPTDPISDTVFTYYPDTVAAKNRIQAITVTNLTANGTLNQTQTTSFTYSFYASGMPSQIVTDGPAGKLTRNDNAQGNLTSSVDALGHTATFSGYNALGLPGSVTDPNGFTVSFGYDARGRTTSVSRTLEAVAATTTFTYDGLGDRTSVTYPDGGWIASSYDGAGRPTYIYTDQGQGQSTRTLGCETIGTAYQVATTLTYNTLSDVTSKAITKQTTTNRTGCDGTSTSTTTTTFYSHRWTYDELGRLTSDLGNNGQNTRFSYDPTGNVLTRTESPNATTTYVTTYTYDAHNELDTATDPQGGVTRYAYDGTGHLAAVTDPKNNTTVYRYDGFGHLLISL